MITAIINIWCYVHDFRLKSTEDNYDHNQIYETYENMLICLSKNILTLIYRAEQEAEGIESLNT